MKVQIVDSEFDLLVAKHLKRQRKVIKQNLQEFLESTHSLDEFMVASVMAEKELMTAMKMVVDALETGFRNYPGCGLD